MLCGVCSTFNCFATTEIISEKLPEIYIKAINPGYTVDSVSNVGEMIEIGKNSDQPFSLAGAAVGYTNSSGNFSILYEFPENSWITGETILLRLASSPDSELAAVNYTKTLAMKGGLSLVRGEETIDEVCWTGKEGCEKDFKSTNPTTLVRNLETGEFEHQEDYVPVYDEKSYYVEVTEEVPEVKPPSQCKGLEFSEILSYYEESHSEQFIELHNYNAEQILMDGCKIRYKNKSYTLSGIVKADEYFAYYPSFSLTKNPTNSNLLEIIDTDGEVIDSLSYPNGQRKGTTYALIGYGGSGEEIWRVTYALTPNLPNIYQEFKTCEEGKVINEETGNCVKVTEVKTTICKEGQYLNVLTGRCKNISTKASTTKVCKEGYYYNEETKRCRKIQENNGADYSLEPETYEEKSSFVALYAVLFVIGIGMIYVVYEFRLEIAKLFYKVFRRSR